MLAAVLARQGSLGEWAPCENRDPVLFAVREHLLFDFALQHVVPYLVGDNLRLREIGPRFFQVADGKVADADRADLAFAVQLLEGFHRVLEGYLLPGVW